MIVKQGRDHVICRSDCVEVAREVQIYFLHRQYLGIAAAGCTALHSETRAQRRFSQCGDRIFADSVHT